MGKEDSSESKGKIRMTITPANKSPYMRTVLEAPSSCDVNELAELSSKLRQTECFSIENVSSVLPSMETQKVDNRNRAEVACLGSRTSGAGLPAVVMDTGIEV
jgi:hypothetical protein